MAGPRKARVPMAEQIRLINECRQVSRERYCSKHLLQLGQPLPESRSGSDSGSELRSS